jgi:hypothetical protein
VRPDIFKTRPPKDLPLSIEILWKPREIVKKKQKGRPLRNLGIDIRSREIRINQ